MPYYDMQVSALSLNGGHMKELLIFLAVIGVWFVLQAYVLPKLGVST